MGIIRIISKKKEVKVIVPHNLCFSIYEHLTMWRKLSLKLKGSTQNTELFQELREIASKLCDLLHENSKLTRTVAGRTIRMAGETLYNRLISAADIEEEDGPLGKSANVFKNQFIMDAENILELFMLEFEVDLSDYALKKPVAEKVVVKKNQKNTKKASSLSELASISNFISEVDDIEARENPSDDDDTKPKKKSKRGLDYTDKDALVLSKYKPYAKQIRFEDEHETGMSFMPTIPILCISKPALYTEVAEELGITIDNMSGYPVFPKQLMVGLMASHKESLVLAKDEKTAKYVVETTSRYLQGKYEILGEPIWIKNMVCFWLIEKSVISKIRRRFPRFIIERWSPACL